MFGYQEFSLATVEVHDDDDDDDSKAMVWNIAEEVDEAAWCC